MRAWEFALEHRAELERFWRSPTGRRFGEGWDIQQPSGGMGVAAIETTKLSVASAVYVAEDMMDVWTAASESFPGEPLLREDIPFESGFVLLPRPLRFLDRRNDTLGVRAFAWCLAQTSREDEPHGIHLSSYAHLDDDLDEWLAANAEMLRSRWGGPLSLLHCSSWQFDLDYMKEESWMSAVSGASAGPDDNIEGSISILRQIQVFFRLVQQRVARPYSYEAHRAVRKRAARGLPDRPIHPVSVVTLRQYRPPEDEAHVPESKEWTHSWIVSGHWRRQWYPKAGAHRLKWIAPYQKGQGPLVLKDRTYQWLR